MIPFPEGKFKTILADPPWPESGGGKIKRGADRHYGLMTVRDIAYLPIHALRHPEGAHLYLWTTNNYLPDALGVVKEWGFTYKTLVTWAKWGRIGLGQYFRGMTEHCIFAVSKALPYRTRPDGKRAQGTTLLGKELIPRPGGHSAKPRQLHEIAELVSHEPRIELFARAPREGWTVWGEEANRGEEEETLFGREEEGRHAGDLGDSPAPQGAQGGDSEPGEDAVPDENPQAPERE